MVKGFVSKSWQDFLQLLWFVLLFRAKQFLHQHRQLLIFYHQSEKQQIFILNPNYKSNIIFNIIFRHLLSIVHNVRQDY